MPSARYGDLIQRVEVLRQHLLPDPFDPTGTYADDAVVRTRTLSFRVLAHAELETYFEDRSVEIAKLAWSSWQETRASSAPLLNLLGFCGQALSIPPETLVAPDENKKKGWPERVELTERIKVAVQDFIRRVTIENHGIREVNLVRMLLPIGLHVSSIDATFVSRLDDFGKRRGEAAHKSSAVQQAVDPKDEYEAVRLLVTELTKLDAELDKLLAQVTTVSLASSTDEASETNDEMAVDGPP
jgi:hypothetical protein